MTTVLHVARAFSAQPTLGDFLDDVDVVELPLPEVLANADLQPELIWVSAATPERVHALRDRFPTARILATPHGVLTSSDVVRLIEEADLVLADGGVLLAVAGLQALSRRLVAVA
jgi:hypothetical protein